jgi:hypothetical protein
MTYAGRHIAEFQPRSTHVSVAERNANGRLIAAAPELLEALEPFAKFACDEPNDCFNCRARAAIKKARGEQE